MVAAKMPVLVAAFLVIVLSLACGGSSGDADSAEDGRQVSQAGDSGDTSGVAGSWRVYSERIDWDAGGAGGAGTTGSVTRELELDDDGRWEFGSSSGTWSAAPIDPDDWDRWGITSYGPQEKIVLDGWNDDSGDGPIEASAGRVDFFWVIYRVDEPEPGTVQLRFGHP